MRNLGKVGMVLSLALGLVGGSALAAPSQSSEEQALKTVTSFYEATKKLDAETYAALSRDVRIATEEDQLKDVKDTFEIFKRGDKQYLLKSYELGEMRKVSDTEYRVPVTLIYDYANYPAYEVPVVMENGQWQVILENIVYVEKQLERSATVSMQQNEGSEWIASNGEFDVYKIKTLAN